MENNICLGGNGRGEPALKLDDLVIADFSGRGAVWCVVC